MSEKDLSNFIDALHSIAIYRDHYSSSIPAQTHADEVISILVAGAKNRGKGAPTVLEEIAKRILVAGENWDRETGKTYCGQMTGPKV